MPQHYFSGHPEGDFATQTKTLRLGDSTFDVSLAPGVFSAHRLDPGTQVLLERGPLPQVDPVKILDLGCGWGPISLFLARRFPGAQVIGVDVNQRALSLCEANASLNGLDNVRALSEAQALDLVPDASLDLLWSNPPIRIGKSALHEILLTWLPKLSPLGHAQLVVSKNLGADSLARWLLQQGWQVQRMGSSRGYRILRVNV